MRSNDLSFYYHNDMPITDKGWTAGGTLSKTSFGNICEVGTEYFTNKPSKSKERENNKWYYKQKPSQIDWNRGDTFIRFNGNKHTFRRDLWGQNGVHWVWTYLGVITPYFHYKP